MGRKYLVVIAEYADHPKIGIPCHDPDPYTSGRTYNETPLHDTELEVQVWDPSLDPIYTGICFTLPSSSVTHKVYLYPEPLTICPEIIIYTTNNVLCSGDTATIYSWIQNTISAQYQWYVNSIAVPYPEGTGSTYAYQPTNKDQVYCTLSGDTCDIINSNTIEFLVYDKRVPTITVDYFNAENPSAESKYICSGDTVLFVSYYTYGGYHPTFQWYTKLSGSWVAIQNETNQTMLYVPQDNEEIGCYMGSNAWCVSPSGVTGSTIVDVEPKLPVSVTISPTGSTCSGSTIMYTATGINSGNTPTYEWFVNYIDQEWDKSAFTYTPSNGDIITTRLTSSLRCTSNNPAIDSLTVRLSENIVVYVQIESSPPSTTDDGGSTWQCTVNSGTTVYFAVSDVVGDCGKATYQWHLLSGSTTYHVGTNSKSFSYIATSGDTIWCEITSDCPCISGSPIDESKYINVEWNLVPNKSVLISCGSNNCWEICTGDTICFTAYTYYFTADPITYQWKINGSNVGTNSPYFCYSNFNNGDEVTCVASQSGNYTSNKITVEVTSVTPTLTISKIPSTSTICEGTLITFYVSTSSNLGTSPTYQWYRSPNGDEWYTVGTNTYYYQTTTMTNGEWVKLIVSNINTLCTTSTSVTSNEIEITQITPSVTPTVSISANPNCIATSDPITFTATGTNSGNTPTIKWYYLQNNIWTLGYTGNPWNAGYNFTGNTSLLVYCQLTSSASCASPSSVDSSVLSLYPCPCGQSLNKVINGGGEDTTDWLYNGGTGIGTGLIGDNWALEHENNTLTGSFSTPYIYNSSNGFTSRYQVVTTRLISPSAGGYVRSGISTNGYSFNVSNGAQKYKLSFKYRCGEWDVNNNSYKSATGNLGVWFKCSDDYIYHIYNDLPPNLGNAVLVEPEPFPWDNGPGAGTHRLSGLFFGHSKNFGDFTFRFEIDEVNLWECPND